LAASDRAGDSARLVGIGGLAGEKQGSFHGLGERLLGGDSSNTHVDVSAAAKWIGLPVMHRPAIQQIVDYTPWDGQDLRESAEATAGAGWFVAFKQ
jgi:hypothetical protein